MIAAVVKVLAAWDWNRRPAGVGRAALPDPAAAGRQPRGAHREIGRLPHLGELGYRDGARAAPRGPPVQQRPAFCAGVRTS